MSYAPPIDHDEHSSHKSKKDDDVDHQHQIQQAMLLRRSSRINSSRGGRLTVVLAAAVLNILFLWTLRKNAGALFGNPGVIQLRNVTNHPTTITPQPVTTTTIKRHKAPRSPTANHQEAVVSANDSSHLPLSFQQKTKRVPNKSPRHVYLCGHHMVTAALARAVFPEVNVTSLARSTPKTKPTDKKAPLDSVTFHKDDVMISHCHGFCLIPIRQMSKLFPGTILTINGEGFTRQCHIGPRSKRIVPLVRSDNDPKYWNASMFSVALLFVSNPRWNQLLREKPKKLDAAENFLAYAATKCVWYRERAFRRLSRIGVVHSIGKCDGNGVGVHVENTTKADHGLYYNSVIFSHYRFTLAMENKVIDGYMTEKILMVFLGRSIPIYYGTREVFDVFNPKAFIWYDIDNPQEALDRVAYLERNRTAYIEMLNEPFLAHGEETLAKHFSTWESNGGGRLKWAIRDRIGFG